ncbi:hypothetical protein HJD18_16400 [Thermoleophilia bacterium SCSIO 60948]|nr:hypothetical protein HJD18_16400 [Thermoleophilia bacterium SCSIO 60948]
MEVFERKLTVGIEPLDRKLARSRIPTGAVAVVSIEPVMTELESIAPPGGITI